MSKASEIFQTLKGVFAQLRKMRKATELILRLGRSLVAVGRHGEKLIEELDGIWKGENQADAPELPESTAE